jgi:hypothetical protein
MLRLLGSVVALAVLGACGGMSGALVRDDAVEILHPAPMEVVRTPLEVRWNGDLGPDESFAVFVDRVPIPPGTSIDDAFEDACDGVPACPDETFLSVRGVHLTGDHEVTIPVLTPRGGVDGASALDVHRVTIVVVDHDGTRRGERAWSTEFRVAR